VRSIAHGGNDRSLRVCIFRAGMMLIKRIGEMESMRTIFVSPRAVTIQRA